MDEIIRQKRQTRWLALGSVLWGLGSVGLWVFWEYLVALEGTTFMPLTPLLFLGWCCIGPFLFLVGIFRLIGRQRVGALILSSALFPILIWGIFKDTMPKVRWEYEKAVLMRQLHDAQMRPFESLPPARNNRVDGVFDVRLVAPKFRLIRDKNGRVIASFVRFRMGLDNGVAYVYDPHDTLTEEIFLRNGKTKYTTTGLGWALSGFGILAGVEALGDHWYRCGFT